MPTYVKTFYAILPLLTFLYLEIYPKFRNISASLTLYILGHLSQLASSGMWHSRVLGHA